MPSTDQSIGQLEVFCQKESTRKLFDRTWAHPQLSRFMIWASVGWLEELANPIPFEYTNTAQADGALDRWVDKAALFESMLKYGMRDPLILGIGLNGFVRLESGNQRLRCFIENKIDFAPIVGYVSDAAIISTSNGLHQGRYLGVDMNLAQTYYGTYVKPDLLISTVRF